MWAKLHDLFSRLRREPKALFVSRVGVGARVQCRPFFEKSGTKNFSAFFEKSAPKTFPRFLKKARQKLLVLGYLKSFLQLTWVYLFRSFVLNKIFAVLHADQFARRRQVLFTGGDNDLPPHDLFGKVGATCRIQLGKHVV